MDFCSNPFCVRNPKSKTIRHNGNLFQTRLDVRELPIDPAYHLRQATTLIRLAQATRDTETAAALMRLANEHTALAEKATVGRERRKTDAER